MNIQQAIFFFIPALAVALLLIYYGNSPSKPVKICHRVYASLIKKQYEEATKSLVKHCKLDCFEANYFIQTLKHRSDEYGSLENAYFIKEILLDKQQQELEFREIFADQTQQTIFFVWEKVGKTWKITEINEFSLKQMEDLAENEILIEEEINDIYQKDSSET